MPERYKYLIAWLIMGTIQGHVVFVRLQYPVVVHLFHFHREVGADMGEEVL